VQSIVRGKYVTKVGTISAFDVKRVKDKYIAYGTVVVTAFAEGSKGAVQEKKVQIVVVKGTRTMDNLYGLYVIAFVERGTETYSAFSTH
jgi:hypothetical protein